MDITSYGTGPENDLITPQLIKTVEDLVRLFKCQGIIRVTPYTEHSISRFQRLPKETREKLFLQTHSFLDICSEAYDKGVGLKDTKKLLQHTLKSFGLVAPKKLYESLSSDDVVEAYDENNIQIFRSLRFMELCNYSVMDVLTNTWRDLFERNEDITEQLFAELQTCIAQGVDVYYSKVPAHIMTEKFATPRGRFKTQMRFLSPLFRGPGQVAGMVTVISAKEVLQATL